MGIAEDIKQSKFRSNHQKAAINIIYSYHWLMERMKSAFADEDLTNQQFNVLRILRGSAPKPLSTLQIRERMLDKMSDTSRIVDRLVIKKLVSKQTCEQDKRLVDVTITKKGLEMLARIDKKEKEFDRLTSNLSSEEADTLSTLLDKIRA